MCIYNIYIHTHSSMYVYIYIYTYKYRGYNMRSSRGPISMNKQVLPNAVTFWLHTVRPMSEAVKLLNLSTDLHTFDGSMSGSSCEKFQCVNVSQICPDEINTIRYNLSYWYQAASRSSLVLCFCVPSPPIPRGTVYNRIKTHLSVASNLTSPATGAGNTRRGQTLMLDIEEPPLGSAKKVQRGQNLLRSMFHLAHLGCTVFSVVLAFNVFSCCIYIYIYIWLIVIVQAIFGFGLTCRYIFLITQNVCFVGIFSTEEVDGVHQNCHRREGVEGIAPCLGPTTFVQFVPTRWTLLFPRVTK